MNVEIIIAATVAVVSGAWALVKIMVIQFSRGLDSRFAQAEEARREGRKMLEARFEQIDQAQRRFERELLELKAELPRQYVLREDQIRSETVLNAKIDAVYAKLELIAERQDRG